MDFFTTLRQRASVRRFAPDPVPDADLGAILDAARTAPTGFNAQPWEFIVLRDAAAIRQLPAQECLAGAGLVVVLLGNPALTPVWREDLSCAAENLQLAVVALGWGTVWIHCADMPQETAVKQLLGVPEDRRVLAFFPIGKPAEPPAQAPKKALTELVHRERYGQPW